MDLLAGRAVFRTLHPFMAAEIPEFQLPSALQYGLVPLVVASAAPQDVLQAYTAWHLQEEARG